MNGRMKPDGTPSSSGRMSTRLSERKRKAADITPTSANNNNAEGSSVKPMLTTPDVVPLDRMFHHNGQCAICLQSYRDPYSTKCRHIFCHSCIFTSLKVVPRCPSCEQPLTKESIYQYNPTMTLPTTLDGTSGGAHPILNTLMSANLSPSEVDNMIDILYKKKETLNFNGALTTAALVGSFLDSFVKKKQFEIDSMQQIVDLVKSDKESLNKSSQSVNVVPSTSGISNVPSGSNSPTSELDPEIPALTSRVMRHYKGLEELYTELTSGILRHLNQEVCDGYDVADSAHLVTQDRTDRIGSFTEVVSAISKYGKVEPIANLNYNIEINPNMSIVSSLEFDKDGDMFVVAGVTRRIKIFNYQSVIETPDDPHFPLTMLSCSSKISNVSWSSPRKNLISSSDYDGQVTIWDVNTTQILKTYKEHEKRCWTVNFNSIDPDILASGSDDAKVKIWSLNSDMSATTIDAKVNVCCVCFSPTDRNQLIFGSADHCVHLYDIRVPSRPLMVFKGHRKAVSYVRYINENEIVSASTDSTLRVWRIDTGECTRVLRGHINEKNFVGLSGNGDHIMCGSENSQVYFYYKGMTDPIVSHYVGKSRNDEEYDGFVSSVCWKRNSDVVLVANSVGNVRFLKVS